MIIGTGIDIVQVCRFKPWVQNPNLACRFFHEKELSVLQRGGDYAVQSLAVRFAAKEAFGKALGSGLRGLALKDICVVSDKYGKPELKLYDSAQILLQNSGADVVHLTMSHEMDYAVACVILEQRSKSFE